MKKATKNEILEIKKILLCNYKDAKTELIYTNIYELLVSVMLSAQCTDKRVNIITPTLFAKFPSTKELSRANISEVKELIDSCSFFNNKAKNLILMAIEIEKNYKGEIPLNKNELVKLAGVGVKTANVVMIEYTGANYMAVDTHVFRVSHRLGLSDAKNVKLTEEDLTKKFKDNLHILHQALVLFGRYVCKAKNPICSECILEKYCKNKKSYKAN